MLIIALLTKSTIQSCVLLIQQQVEKFLKAQTFQWNLSVATKVMCLYWDTIF